MCTYGVQEAINTDYSNKELLELSDHFFKFFIGKHVSCQELALILDVVKSFMPHLVLSEVERHARQLQSKQFSLLHDRRNDKDLQ